MGEVEEVQEQMKADMEAMKEKMVTMMETMVSMKRMMEVNTAIVIAASTASEVDPTHPSGLNQVNAPVLDMVGQGGKALGSTGGKFRTSIPSHHMAYLPTIQHIMVHTLLMRMSITPLSYSLRANNPNLVRYKSLNP